MSGGGKSIQGRRGLAAGTPLLLLPVRIETRFADNPQGGSALLLRVYPDTLSTSSFETALTNDEVTAGAAYWNQIWSVGNPPADPDDLSAPWRVLAGAYGAARAAWIADTMTSDQPGAATSRPDTARPSTRSTTRLPCAPVPREFL